MIGGRAICIILTLGCIPGTVTSHFLFLDSGAIKIITGLGIPVDVEMSGGSLSWFANVQVFYRLPNNVTHFEPYRVMQKRSVKRTFNRPNLYRAFGEYFDRLGLSGGDCVHRVICEVAAREINHEDNGLLGDVIHILFSPGDDSEAGLERYKAAQRLGLFNSSACGDVYADCYVTENSIFYYN